MFQGFLPDTLVISGMHNCPYTLCNPSWTSYAQLCEPRTSGANRAVGLHCPRRRGLPSGHRPPEPTHPSNLVLFSCTGNARCTAATRLARHSYMLEMLLYSVGVTIVITQGSIFKSMRNAGPAKWQELLNCPLCLGFWVGLWMRGVSDGGDLWLAIGFLNSGMTSGSQLLEATFR